MPKSKDGRGVKRTKPTDGPSTSGSGATPKVAKSKDGQGVKTTTSSSPPRTRQRTRQVAQTAANTSQQATTANVVGGNFHLIIFSLLS